MSSRMAWRTAGKVGCGGGPLILFFPPCCFEPTMLEESVGDHRHQRMTMQALPGSALEVIEAEFFFQLLVSLLANPSRLDGGRQGGQGSLCRQVGEIVFPLSRHPVFADKPSLVAWQMLLAFVPDPLRRSVGDPHADSRKTSLELSFRARAPTDGAPFDIGQHVLGRYRQNVWDVPLTGTTALGNRPDHPHLGRVNLEMPRNADRPRQFASREPLTERRAQPITGVRQHAAEANTGSSFQSDVLPAMVGPSKSRPPMSHRKSDSGIPCCSKSAKVVLGRVLIKRPAMSAFGQTGH